MTVSGSYGLFHDLLASGMLALKITFRERACHGTNRSGNACSTRAAASAAKPTTEWEDIVRV